MKVSASEQCPLENSAKGPKRNQNKSDSREECCKVRVVGWPCELKQLFGCVLKQIIKDDEIFN